MVGQTTEQPLPKDVKELEDEVNKRLIHTKMDTEKLEKSLYEIELGIKAKRAEIAVLEDMLYLLQHMGEKTGPNRKKLTD